MRSYVLPVVLLAKCKNPGSIANGKRIGDVFYDGKTVAFRCRAGFTLIGLQLLTCIGGRWDSDKPVCKGKPDKPDKPVCNGKPDKPDKPVCKGKPDKLDKPVCKGKPDKLDKPVCKGKLCLNQAM